MSSNPAETKAEAQIESGIAPADHASTHDEKAMNAERAGAIEAEAAEYNMGVLQAVKEYPMAAFWAFIMSCTIVSGLPTIIAR